MIAGRGRGNFHRGCIRAWVGCLLFGDFLGGLLGSGQQVVGFKLCEKNGRKEEKMEKKARFHVVSQKVSGPGIPHYASGTGRMVAAVEWISRSREIFSSCWSLDSNGLIQINKEVFWIG